jgi:hypothetical protein
MDIRENGIVITQALIDHFNGEVTLENFKAVCGRADVQAKLKWHTGHDPEHRKRVWESWWKDRAPKDLLPTPENLKKFITQLHACYGSEVTYPNLDRCLEDLSSQLEYQAPPTAAERAAEAIRKVEELEKRDLALRMKEARENVELAKSCDERRKQAELLNEAKKKGDMDKIYEENVNTMISIFECYSGPNRIDYGKTESLRKQLRGIRVWTDHTRTKVDWKQTAFKVREAISNIDSDGSSLLDRRGI